MQVPPKFEIIKSVSISNRDSLRHGAIISLSVLLGFLAIMAIINIVIKVRLNRKVRAYKKKLKDFSIYKPS